MCIRDSPKTAITSHAALAAKRARHLAAGDATPRHQPAPASVLEQKALIAEEQPVRGAQARAVTPDEGSHQRRDLRAVVYDAEKKTLLWQAPEGVQPVPYGEALTMARPPRYVRAFYDVASGETCWTADERVPAAAPADAASEDASDAASDACVDARGTAASLLSPGKPGGVLRRRAGMTVKFRHEARSFSVIGGPGQDALLWLDAKEDREMEQWCIALTEHIALAALDSAALALKARDVAATISSEDLDAYFKVADSVGIYVRSAPYGGSDKSSNGCRYDNIAVG